LVPTGEYDSDHEACQDQLMALTFECLNITKDDIRLRIAAFTGVFVKYGEDARNT
jgi:hypothetical protein